MDNEKENSLDRSVQVEKIIEFYKDKEPEAKQEANDNKNDHHIKALFSKSKVLNLIINKVKLLTIKYLNKLPYIKIKAKEASYDEVIKTHSFGLTERGKMHLFRTLSGVISIIIIILSFVLAIYLPGNEYTITALEKELRAEDEYISIKSRYEALKNEVAELDKSNDYKEETLGKIEDIDNSKAQLRTQITEKKNELNALNSQILSKRAEIEALDESISQKVASEIIYTPGKYTVGKHFAAGKYYVTGTGKFMVATSSGKSKMNISLGTTPVLVDLSNNDIVKFDSKVKFTSAY